MSSGRGGKELDPRRKKFAVEYLTNGLNASAAARSIGCTGGYAIKRGCELLRNSKVQNYIRQNLELVEKKLDVTLEWKIKKIKKVIDNAIPDDEEQAFIAEHARVGLMGISELNKMQGDYAPLKNINANLNSEVDGNILYDLVKKYDKDY